LVFESWHLSWCLVTQSIIDGCSQLAARRTNQRPTQTSIGWCRLALLAACSVLHHEYHEAQ